MIKQEEIREGIKACYNAPVESFGDKVDTPDKLADYVTDGVLAYLHLQGVVIKVDRKLSKDEVPCGIPCDKCVAIEPLIKD